MRVIKQTKFISSIHSSCSWPDGLLLSLFWSNAGFFDQIQDHKINEVHLLYALDVIFNKDKLDLNVSNADNTTLLIRATKSNRQLLAKRLLELCCNVDLPDSTGSTVNWDFKLEAFHWNVRLIIIWSISGIVLCDFGWKCWDVDFAFDQKPKYSSHKRKWAIAVWRGKRFNSQKRKFNVHFLCPWKTKTWLLNVF